MRRTQARIFRTHGRSAEQDVSVILDDDEAWPDVEDLEINDSGIGSSQNSQQSSQAFGMAL